MDKNKNELQIRCLSPAMVELMGGQNELQVIPRCSYIEDSKLKLLGAKLEGHKGVSTILFNDHLHIQWELKIRRNGFFRILKNNRELFVDEYYKYNDCKKGFRCDYNMKLNTDNSYTAIYISDTFEPQDILFNLICGEKPPPEIPVAYFIGRLRELPPEPEKTKPEQLKNELSEKLQIQRIEDGYNIQRQVDKIENVFKFKSVIKEKFKKQRAVIINGRKMEELSKEEYEELQDLEFQMNKTLKDDEYIKRLMNKR